MALLGKNTQGKIDDTQKRLAATNQELDALDQLAPPTSDLEVEESSALRRLARKEALNRVKAALSSELQTLQSTLAAEREEARRAHEAKVRREFDAAKAALVDSLWAAYATADKWRTQAVELDSVAPNFQPRANQVGDLVAQIASQLEALGAARVQVNAHTFKQEAIRLSS